MLQALATGIGVIALFGFLTLFARSYGAVSPPVVDSKFEIRLVEAVIIAEAGGEGFNGWRAVAEVIRNRMDAKQKSAYKVVTAPWQFSCLNGKTNYEQFIRETMTDKWLADMRTYELARAVCEHRLKPSDLTKGATHYHAVEVTPPNWASPKKKTVQIGRHVFYRL